MKTIALLSLAAGLAGLGHAALAHHSVAAEFDTSLHGELEGEVTRVWFTNPHIRYQLTVTAEDGTTETWELQAGNVSTLSRQNWTADSIVVGDRLTVSGDLGRGGAKKIRVRKITLADGRTFPPPNNVSTERSHIVATIGKDYSYPGPSGEHPVDITGPWRNDYMWRVTVDDLEPKPVPFTAEGRQMFAATEAWQDYALRCLAPGLPRIFGAPYDVEVVDAGSHYLMVYVEHNTPRRIWMDGRTAPSDQQPSPMGFSTGRWDGDTLIVETTHLSPGWLDGSGLPMSGDARIVERYRVSDDRLSISRTMTIYDPVYYTEPLVRQRYSARSDTIRIVEQAPCDPDSYYRDLAASGRLEEHFERD